MCSPTPSPPSVACTFERGTPGPTSRPSPYRSFSNVEHDQCWCGTGDAADTYLRYGPALGDTACNVECTGDATEMCGGSLIMSVYGGKIRTQSPPCRVAHVFYSTLLCSFAACSPLRRRRYGTQRNNNASWAARVDTVRTAIILRNVVNAMRF